MLLTKDNTKQTVLNDAWQAASQDMYAQSQSAQPGAEAGGEGGGASQDDGVTDVDFEEVK